MNPNINKFAFFDSIRIGGKFMHYSEKDGAYITMVKVSLDEGKPEKEFSTQSQKFNSLEVFALAPKKC